MEYEKIDSSTEILRRYWDGPTNMFSRYYTYFQRCLTLFNEGKYLLGLIGLGIWKSTIVIPGWALILGTIVGFPLMIAIGRWHLFRVQKATEFINAQHGSITGYNSYNMQIDNLNQNEEIIRLLKKLTHES